MIQRDKKFKPGRSSGSLAVFNGLLFLAALEVTFRERPAGGGIGQGSGCCTAGWHRGSVAGHRTGDLGATEQSWNWKEWHVAAEREAPGSPGKQP